MDLVYPIEDEINEDGNTEINIQYSNNPFSRTSAAVRRTERRTISNNTRQRRSFAFNGRTYPLRGLALAVVNDYVSQNPDVTFEQLRQIFDIRLNFDRKPLIRRLNEVTQSEREHKRVFLDSPIRLHNDEVYVSSQWSYDVDFPRFQEILNNLDYQVQEL